MLYCTCPTIQINPDLLKLDLSITSTLDCSDVDLLRQDLIDHYPKVNATLPWFMSEKAPAEGERGRESVARVAMGEEYRNVV